MYICISVFGPESWTGMNFNDVTVWRQNMFRILDFDTFGFYQQIKLRNGSANSQAVLLQSLMARVWRYQDGSSKTEMRNGCCQWNARRSGHAALAIGSVYGLLTYIWRFSCWMLVTVLRRTWILQRFSQATQPLGFFAFQPCTSTNTTIHQLILLVPVKRIQFNCGWIHHVIDKWKLHFIKWQTMEKTCL